MVCPACGNTLEDGARFCPRCGAQMAAAAPPIPSPSYATVVAPPRVRRHLQTLGTLWYVFGAYRLIAGLLGLFVFRTMAWHHLGGPDWPFGHHFSGWMALVPVLVTTTVVMAALALFAGYSLLQRRPWGRILAIVLGILAMIKLPLGTALGIYTLWVLAPSSSAMEYEAIADQD